MIGGKGACLMLQEHVGAESEGAPQIALPRFFWDGRCIGQILESQQQHCETLKNAEASIADGVASKVARRKRARSLRIIGGIVTSSAMVIPS